MFPHIRELDAAFPRRRGHSGVTGALAPRFTSPAAVSTLVLLLSSSLVLSEDAPSSVRGELGRGGVTALISPATFQ